MKHRGPVNIEQARILARLRVARADFEDDAAFVGRIDARNTVAAMLAAYDRAVLAREAALRAVRDAVARASDGLNARRAMPTVAASVVEDETATAQAHPLREDSEPALDEELLPDAPLPPSRSELAARCGENSATPTTPARIARGGLYAIGYVAGWIVGLLTGR